MSVSTASGGRSCFLWDHPLCLSVSEPQLLGRVSLPDLEVGSQRPRTVNFPPPFQGQDDPHTACMSLLVPVLDVFFMFSLYIFEEAITRSLVVLARP